MEVLRVLQVPVFDFAVLFVLDLQRLDGCGPVARKQLHHVDCVLGFFWSEPEHRVKAHWDTFEFVGIAEYVGSNKLVVEAIDVVKGESWAACIPGFVACGESNINDKVIIFEPLLVNHCAFSSHDFWHNNYVSLSHHRGFVGDPVIDFLLRNWGF